MLKLLGKSGKPTAAQVKALAKQAEQISTLKAQVKQLRAEANRVPELKRQVRWLEKVATRAFSDYRGFVMLAPPELCMHVGRVGNAANYWNQGLESSDKVREVFGDDPGGPVLDWGCGVGRTVHWLRDRGTWPQWYRGCDVDPDGVAWLRTQIDNELKVCGDLPPLPYEADTFAGLFCFSVLTHIHPDRHEAWFREIHRVLAPGGRAYITLNGDLAAERASITADELAAFTRTGRLYSTREGHYKDAAFAAGRVTRPIVEGLFEIERYEPAGYHNMDVFLVRKPAA